MTTYVPAAKSDLYTLDLRVARWMVAPESDPADRLEVAILPNGATALRHSATGRVLFFTAAEWTAFVRGCQDGEFEQDIDTAECQAILVKAVRP
ncbi:MULTISPECIES: DUF397 domain-containing protein [unclassified Kitasatospora]|uniref:DUF397 domain-containing protein n=1 Tax=unclassified Kitasatospora TaxID=2633591 RepID=UPI000B123D30|nr:DUF397 domain-containing protein [Kitasatospora sp. MY 5-36]